jgi:hypothetical protein
MQRGPQAKTGVEPNKEMKFLERLTKVSLKFMPLYEKGAD